MPPKKGTTKTQKKIMAATKAEQIRVSAISRLMRDCKDSNTMPSCAIRGCGQSLFRKCKCESMICKLWICESHQNVSYQEVHESCPGSGSSSSSNSVSNSGLNNGSSSGLNNGSSSGSNSSSSSSSVQPKMHSFFNSIETRRILPAQKILSYNCTYCPKAFETPQGRSAHENSHTHEEQLNPTKKPRFGSVKLRDAPAPAVPPSTSPFEVDRAQRREQKAATAERAAKTDKAKADDAARFRKILSAKLFDDDAVPVVLTPMPVSQQANLTVAQKLYILDYYHKKHDGKKHVGDGSGLTSGSGSGLTSGSDSGLTSGSDSGLNSGKLTRGKKETVRWVREYYNRPKFAKSSLLLMIKHEERIRNAVGTVTRRHRITKASSCAEYPEMDVALALWIRETRQVGIPVETYMLAEEGLLTRLILVRLVIVLIDRPIHRYFSLCLYNFYQHRSADHGEAVPTQCGCGKIPIFHNVARSFLPAEQLFSSTHNK